MILEDLKMDEGWRPWAYQDSEGYWTIGYGFLIDKRKNAGIPKHIAEQWLEWLIAQRTAQLDSRLPWWREQPEEVQRALLNMSYQMGVDGLLEFKKMLAALKAGDRNKAADEALDSKWATQTPARAARIAALIRGS